MERTSLSFQASSGPQMPSVGLWTIWTPALSETVPVQVDGTAPLEQAVATGSSRSATRRSVSLWAENMAGLYVRGG